MQHPNNKINRSPSVGFISTPLAQQNETAPVLAKNKSRHYQPNTNRCPETAELCSRFEQICGIGQNKRLLIDQLSDRPTTESSVGQMGNCGFKEMAEARRRNPWIG